VVVGAADVVADASGVPVEAIGVVQDITDRREAEVKAQGVESQLRLLAENSQDLIFRYRIADPGFEFVSPASLAITGYTPDEFYAQPELFDRLIDSAARDLWLARVLSGHDRAAVDIELVRKDGSKLWVSQRLDVVRGAGGEIIGVDGITRDISDRKAAELRLEHEALHDPLTALPNGCWQWTGSSTGCHALPVNIGWLRCSSWTWTGSRSSTTRGPRFRRFRADGRRQ